MDIYDNNGDGWWSTGWKRTEQLGLQNELTEEWNHYADALQMTSIGLRDQPDSIVWAGNKHKGNTR
jgi:hypothetical protein